MGGNIKIQELRTPEPFDLMSMYILSPNGELIHVKLYNYHNPNHILCTIMTEHTMIDYRTFPKNKVVFIKRSITKQPNCHVLHCEACHFPNPTAEEMIFTLVQ